MAYGIKLKVWGDYACFSRPEMKVERVSYDVITPSAARGVLEAIYWKPEMRWIIKRLHVLNPIRFSTVRRNEIDSKIPVRSVKKAISTGEGPLSIEVSAHRQQRAAVILKDVCYGIEADIQVLHHEGPEDKPEAKHLDQFCRRAARGQCFHHPYLGTREFPAAFELVEDFPVCHSSLEGRRDLGYMLHDMQFITDKDGTIVDANSGRRLRAEPRFTRFTMCDGIIEVPSIEGGVS